MHSKVILLVEDNPDDADLTIRALQKANIKNQVIVAHDGVEAMDFLSGTGKFLNHPARNELQLILLDLKLPRVNGFEVLRRLRAEESTRRLPVAILTSSREDRDIVESYDKGANSYICKPVDIDQFISAVQQLGLYWLLLNETP
jgi:two-component system response regulator